MLVFIKGLMMNDLQIAQCADKAIENDFDKSRYGNQEAFTSSPEQIAQDILNGNYDGDYATWASVTDNSLAIAFMDFVAEFSQLRGFATPHLS